MSLIAFPTRELFVEKLDQFDLVIFDRYRERGILPLAYFDNIARYVENGGALLVAAGPGIRRTSKHLSHAARRGAAGAGRPATSSTQRFRPMVTATGLAHPVTHDLPGANEGGKPPSWGRWFRLIGAKSVSGETRDGRTERQPASGARPRRQGPRGRIPLRSGLAVGARLEGGGPDAELLRRLAHWLMKEPELEEERLTAAIAGGQIVIDRHTMAETAEPVTRHRRRRARPRPSTLTETEPGIWRGSAKADELGLYRLTDGTLSAVAAAGPAQSQGSRRHARDRYDPQALGARRAAARCIGWRTARRRIRRVEPGDACVRRGLDRLRDNGAYRVTSVEQEPLLPAWLALILLLGTLLLAWRVEGPLAHETGAPSAQTGSSMRGAAYLSRKDRAARRAASDRPRMRAGSTGPGKRNRPGGSRAKPTRT